jgi:hypothetical protein
VGFLGEAGDVEEAEEEAEEEVAEREFAVAIALTGFDMAGSICAVN